MQKKKKKIKNKNKNKKNKSYLKIYESPSGINFSIKKSKFR